jgi:hypothetical protein
MKTSTIIFLASFLLISCHGDQADLGKKPSDAKVTPIARESGARDKSISKADGPSSCTMPNQTKCLDETILQTCIAGIWAPTNCLSVCQNEPSSTGKCVSDPSPMGSMCNCVPSTSSGKKIGDPCQSSIECTSNQCFEWCTQYCESTAACGVNSKAMPNLCAYTNQGNYMCFPSCNDGTNCADFPNTFCTKEFKLIEGVSLPYGICTIRTE